MAVPPPGTQARNLISMREISSESELGHRLVTLTSAGNSLGASPLVDSASPRTIRNILWKPGYPTADKIKQTGAACLEQDAMEFTRCRGCGK